MRLTWWGKGVLDDRGSRRRLIEVRSGGLDRSFRLVGVARDRMVEEGPEPRARRSRQLRYDLARFNLSVVPALLWPSVVGGICLGTTLLAFSAFTVVRADEATEWRTVWLGAGLLAALGLLAIGCSVLAVPLVRWNIRRLHRRLAGLPLVCLACGFDLTGVPEAGDGLVVCPECGGAWEGLSSPPAKPARDEVP